MNYSESETASMEDRTKVALTLNTNISVETQIPSFRRTTMQNVRQSWVSTKPPSIPEAESMNIQPTAILEKNMTTAKSRLSIIIQKGTPKKVVSARRDSGFLGSPTAVNESYDLETYVDVLLSPQSLQLNRPISNISSSTCSELSDFSHSVSSSLVSGSNGTNNQDNSSISDMSMSSTSPTPSLVRHRYSVPTESESTSSRQDDATPRRASMPFLSH
ncbi:17731_t:CDS:1, partial [Acaulospora morrowiae]